MRERSSLGSGHVGGWACRRHVVHSQGVHLAMQGVETSFSNGAPMIISVKH